MAAMTTVTAMTEGAKLAHDLARLSAATAQVEGAELATAFAAFSSAAKSLEKSYLSLGQEVCRLRKELETERDLRRRRDALAEIAALLAHEIRNPLASMDLFAGLLAGSALGEKEKGWVEQILAALRILSATVNNVLEFHSRRAADFGREDLNDLLRSLEMLLAPVAHRARVRWVAELAPGPLWIKADRQRMEQVFMNLALNTFRFASQGGILRVRTTRERERAGVSFEDAGPGIAPELLARIFDARVTTCASGSGLGLSIAKHIIEQHGGTIRVTSTPGAGTCFHIVLPLAGPTLMGANSCH